MGTLLRIQIKINLRRRLLCRRPSLPLVHMQALAHSVSVQGPSSGVRLRRTSAAVYRRQVSRVVEQTRRLLAVCRAPPSYQVLARHVVVQRVLVQHGVPPLERPGGQTSELLSQESYRLTTDAKYIIFNNRETTIEKHGGIRTNLVLTPSKWLLVYV